jgi:hypothetical protein
MVIDSLRLKSFIVRNDISLNSNKFSTLISVTHSTPTVQQIRINLSTFFYFYIGENNLCLVITNFNLYGFILLFIMVIHC